MREKPCRSCGFRDAETEDDQCEECSHLPPDDDDVEEECTDEDD